MTSRSTPSLPKLDNTILLLHFRLQRIFYFILFYYHVHVHMYMQTNFLLVMLFIIYTYTSPHFLSIKTCIIFSGGEPSISGASGKSSGLKSSSSLDGILVGVDGTIRREGAAVSSSCAVGRFSVLPVLSLNLCLWGLGLVERYPIVPIEA